jgi:hypothetical protein
MKRFPFILFALASLLPAGSFQMTYQGIFLDKNGAGMSLNDTLTFKLFSSTTASAVLWQETHLVKSKTGVFTVALGSKTDLPKSLFNNDSLFLEISKGFLFGQRNKIGINAYAVRSFQSDTSGFSLRSKFADSALASNHAAKSDTAAYSVKSHKADTAAVCSTVIHLPVADSAKRSFLADSAKRAWYADSARTIANAPRATLADSAIGAFRSKIAATADTARAAGTARKADSAAHAVQASLADSARTTGDSYWMKMDTACVSKLAQVKICSVSIDNKRILFGLYSIEFRRSPNTEFH